MAEKLEMKRAQGEAFDEDVAKEQVSVATNPTPSGDGTVASFARDGLYDTPSAFIRKLVADLPPTRQLTRRQTLFVANFADVCDKAWEDEQKPPDERRTHHMLLLGAGGTGKTHVVQNLVFEAVRYIWPEECPESPSMLIVASSNAQAKNISTPEWTAKTLHSAASMRVQQMTNSKMRPGDKAASLERLWKNVRVLVIEEVSMVSAANYNMLNFRAMYGRTKSHAVSEGTYTRPHP